jgi:hypothetical protein
VTSAHLKLAAATWLATAPGIAWGNGQISTTPNAGTAVSITCGTCHNPHGNGLYRILRPIPTATGLTVATVPANVTDATTGGAPLAQDVPADDARNYTVVQTDSSGVRGVYLASDVQDVTTSDTSGDYWHRRVPWTSGTRSDYDAPNGDVPNFTAQMNAWCTTCHTRYLAANFDPTTDAIFTWRHSISSSRACTTCHVAHGTNAKMTGAAAAVQYPGQTAGNPSSRLLKIDNRGTCQTCHDPATDFEGVGDQGTTPDPTYP